MTDADNKTKTEDTQTVTEEENAPENQEKGTIPEESVAYFKDQWMRAVAENQNTIRRLEKEKADATQYALFSFAKDIIAVADHLESALRAAPEDQKEESNLLKGVAMTLTHIKTIFKQHHLEKVSAEIGNVPNPAHHQTVEQKPHPSIPANTIAQVLQDGYRLYDRLVRPALVTTSSGPEPETQDLG